MKKQYIITALILIIFIVLYNLNKLTYINEDVNLRNQIIETVKHSESIDFPKIANFEWDTMYIFTPYSKPEDILNVDGVKNYNSNFRIEFLDSINMIAFVKSNKLVSYVELPRNYGDITSHIKFNKTETKFYIKDKTIIFDNK